MAIQDPFDKVLTKLGVYQHIQGMRSIRTAAVPVTNNNAVPTQSIRHFCRIFVFLKMLRKSENLRKKQWWGQPKLAVTHD
jgi:hypothetical protein